MNHAHDQRILILDFGSQYSQLIARRVRALGVYCELHPYDWSEDEIRNFAPNGIIFSGGPESVTSKSTPRAPDIVFQLGCPLLGICYGMQTMAAQLGGAVSSSSIREFGHVSISLLGNSRLFAGIEEPNTDVWMSHGDQVTALPHHFVTIATSHHTPIEAMADESRKFYGVQFHPEVTHTARGMKILENFVRAICGCESNWTTPHIIDEAIESIRKKVGNEHVILGLSGGVDSAVAAALLHRAIGNQLTCIFVDNGLLRLGEAHQVKEVFGQHFKINLICVDAKERFLSQLENVEDPEQKRKIIGRIFIDCFDEEANKIKNAKWLAQGTIYSDVIESAGTKSGGAHVIKSHHNVGGLPAHMKLKLLEPLRELFKDEVRQVGLGLGLPKSLINRHPFPGPGLGVRVLGEVKREYLEVLRQADHIFIEELHKHNLYHKVSQAFAVYLPVKSVGVVGDARQYEHVIALRAVETQDFMTAHWSHLPYEVLGAISNRILNEISGVSRVVYDVSGKPPATIEWE